MIYFKLVFKTSILMVLLSNELFSQSKCVDFKNGHFKLEDKKVGTTHT